MNSMTFSVVVFCCIIAVTTGQYRNYTAQYAQTMAANENTLKEEVEAHPDTNLFFFPDRALLSDDSYNFYYPLSADFRIGLLIDPCRFNAYNCCLNVFGTAEYPALLKSNLASERIYKYVVLAEETEVSSNYYLVYEDGSAIVTAARRGADDDIVHDTDCVSDGVPYSYCQGRNYATSRSALRPNCTDNNSTLDTLAGCYDIYGNFSSYCVQVGFSSNAFIAQCNNSLTTLNNHCGTFLEIHMPLGSPYQDTNVIISETQILERNVTGYYTTTLPLTWMGNNSKVLCTYSESAMRIGSLVYILPTAPVCCCAPPYQSTSRVGSFQCPIGASGSGSLAKRSNTKAEILTVDSLVQAYPYCHIDLNWDIDQMMCSAYDEPDQRHYTRVCRDVNITATGVLRPYGSIDLGGLYDGVCQYYKSCANTLDAGKCLGTDLRFTFIGQVGVVTRLENSWEVPQVWVSFNNLRTSYQFSQQDVQLETAPMSMYEIWWVVRSKVDFTVQKRKGFNVTNPQCTFDTTNNRYFPYTILKDGVALATSAVP